MVLIPLKPRLLRHLMMSLALLWAVLLHCGSAFAYDSAIPEAQESTTVQAQENGGGSDYDHDLQTGQLYLAQEGTISSCLLSLHPATTDTRTHALSFAGQQAITPYTVRAPGGSFFCQFLYTFVQPQAP